MGHPESCAALSPAIVSVPTLGFQFVHFVNLLKPTGHLMRQQFNIQQLYVLPTL